MSRAAAAAVAAEYHSKDFQWETLKHEIESDPSLQYHLLPFISPIPQQQQRQQQEAEEDAQAWKLFHIRHSTGRFFKERRYLLKEFPELVSRGELSTLLEVGCGNGSTVLPILRGNKEIIVYACDCSDEALEKANKEIVDGTDAASFKHRFHPFHCDFSLHGFPKWLACDSCQKSFLPKQYNSFSDVESENEVLVNASHSWKESGCCIGGVDFVTMIFTLSAVSPHRMPTAITECFSVLNPGGLLLFRDYGLYDMTMLRFEPHKRVGFREYMRSDGTRSYFFCLETVRDLFLHAGFIEVLTQL
ncbi:methyltransferase-like protein 6 [Tripterygium wilfordii]|uniref:tRNA N(3)-methylcytidine methyltransferase n=1 Tax=Tripterygium wilfordii TaxID=458696 RepID=A0A7J7CZL7_TRIWF|nr:methyltransferase-like protein 6 [Tripterygium wilfordii]